MPVYAIQRAKPSLAAFVPYVQVSTAEDARQAVCHYYGMGCAGPVAMVLELRKDGSMVVLDPMEWLAGIRPKTTLSF